MSWVSDMSEAIAFAPINLRGAFDAILNGNFDEAKSVAQLTANHSRLRQNTRLVDTAGKAWQVADLLGRAKEALDAKNYEEAKSLAKEAADLLRDLRDNGRLRGQLAEDLLDQAGALWNEANDLAKSNPTGGTLNVAPIDQHALSHGDGGVFCGVVTALMAAKANGSNLSTSYSDISYIASKMYYSGRGTSGKRHGLLPAPKRNAKRFIHHRRKLQRHQQRPEERPTGADGGGLYPRYGPLHAKRQLCAIRKPQCRLLPLQVLRQPGNWPLGADHRNGRRPQQSVGLHRD